MYVVGCKTSLLLSKKLKKSIRYCPICRCGQGSQKTIPNLNIYMYQMHRKENAPRYNLKKMIVSNSTEKNGIG